MKSDDDVQILDHIKPIKSPYISDCFANMSRRNEVISIGRERINQRKHEPYTKELADTI